MQLPDDKIEAVRATAAAMRDGDHDRILQLLDSHHELIHQRVMQRTWLHFAAREGLVEVARELIARGCNINEKGGYDDSNPLNHAACNGQLEMTRFLLQAGSELDSSEPERNPLFGAIQEGRLDIVQLLVEHGVDMSISYSGERWDNVTPLQFAIELGKTEIRAWLQEYYDSHPGVLGTNHIS